MIGQTNNSTALLATTFGSMLLMAEHGGVDERTARELIVLARVLETRLAAVRKSLTEAIEAPSAEIHDMFAAPELAYA